MSQQKLIAGIVEKTLSNHYVVKISLLNNKEKKNIYNETE